MQATREAAVDVRWGQCAWGVAARLPCKHPLLHGSRGCAHWPCRWFDTHPCPCCHALELENHLQISEKAVAEFIIDMAKDKANVDQFKKVRQWMMVCRQRSSHHQLVSTTLTHFIPRAGGEACCSAPMVPCPQAMGGLGLGDALNDALVERFWSIIQHLTPGAGGGAAGSSKPLVTARPGEGGRVGS